MDLLTRWQQTPDDVLDYDPDGLLLASPGFSCESLAMIRAALMHDLARPTTREGRSAWAWRQTHLDLLQLKAETGRR